jgi:hypothetical protein
VKAFKKITLGYRSSYRQMASSDIPVFYGLSAQMRV